MGHASETYLRWTAKNMDIILTGEKLPCQGCAEGKLKQKAVSKVPIEESSKPGERFGMDISSSSSVSMGGNKYWALWIDYGSNYVWSIFLKEKSDLVEKGLIFIKERIKEFNNNTIKIRCDNGGENQKLMSTSKSQGLNVIFEVTAAGTPQQNGKVERMIATLLGKMIACMMHAGFT